MPSKPTRFDIGPLRRLKAVLQIVIAIKGQSLPFAEYRDRAAVFHRAPFV
ncbi:hypothetical protein OHAE_1522 [Ochrobactrum soli]|uniref:Uncharacterized protein n=1 Tax=Ochrobactrum soli TaxID=2448455 RepID=A0A2P9HNF5_9HYPH|nr:hypothetical protein OHAE_1522 [[Ochrobactrum] soli]